MNGVKDWILQTLNNKMELGELKESTIYSIIGRETHNFLCGEN